MGFFDLFKNKEANQEKKDEIILSLINLLAEEGKTKKGYFKCVRCNKIYPIRYFACHGFYKDNHGNNVVRANCRNCLEKDKERGVTMAWGRPIEETMLTGEGIELAYHKILLNKKTNSRKKV